MAVKTIRFDPSGGAVDVEVFIGQVQFGDYTVTLFDQNGKSPDSVGQGNNADDLPDKFAIDKPAGELEGRLLGWRITIGSPVGGAGERYSAKVTVSQDGNRLADSPFEYNGPLDAAKIVIDFGRFQGA